MTRPADHDFLRAVCARLSTARINAGFTHKTAAERLGKPRPQTIGDWESGKVNFSITDLRALCELYATSTDFILGLSQTPALRANCAVVNLAAERAILAAQNVAEVEAAAKALLAETAPGITIGYRIPDEFEVVPTDEYEQRVKSAQHKVDRLHPGFVAGIVRAVASIFTGKRRQEGRNG